MINMGRPILIVFRRDAFQYPHMVALSRALHEGHGIGAYIIATADPNADDIRLWDLGKLTKIEFQEVKKLVEEYAKWEG